MKSKVLLNPNCSEVVAKLPVETMAEAKELLRMADCEVFRIDTHLHAHISILNMEQEKSNVIADKDNPNLPDFIHHSRLILHRGNYNGDEGIYVMGSQHCQIQLYPTIKKIQDKLNIEFCGFDGGYDFEELFQEWIDEGAKINDFQEGLRDEVKRLMKIKKIKEIAENVFEVVDCIECKKYSEGEKYLLLKKAYKEHLEKNKEKLIKEKKEDERYKNILNNVTDDEIFKQIVNQAMWEYMDPLFYILNNKKIRKHMLNR